MFNATQAGPATRSPAFLKDVDLAARFGVSRVTIWRWAREGRLPSPVRLGPGSTRWRRTEIEQWEGTLQEGR